MKNVSVRIYERMSPLWFALMDPTRFDRHYRTLIVHMNHRENHRPYFTGTFSPLTIKRLVEDRLPCRGVKHLPFR